MTSDTIDKKRHEALSLLKPICIALMQEFSPSNANSLQCVLHGIDKEIIQEILQYLLFPIQNALHQKSLSESELCDVCSTLVIILQKACIDRMQIFVDLFNPLVLILSTPGNPSQVCSKSEESKASVVTLMTALFKSATDSVLKDVYSLKFLPAIGQVITLILSIAELEKSRSLQISSLDCLMALMQSDAKYGSCNEVMLGDFFAFCLPGVTMATTRIISGDQKQGHAVIRKAMMAWTRIIHLTMADSLVEKSKKRLIASGHNTVNSDHEKLRSLKIQRNGEWVKASATKVKLLLTTICNSVSHSNWRVRDTLVDLLKNLAMTCSKSLQECIPKLLDSLVALITDEYGNVASKASSTLQAFAAAQKGTDGERTLREILEENLHSLVTSLPRRIRMSDEEEKPVLIKLLKGYILLLDRNIASVVNSAPHLKRLSLALVQSLEMETSDMKIMEERQTLLDYEADTFFSKESRHVWKPRRYFKYFRDESVMAELLSVCRLLGKYGNVLTLVDHFLDLYHESSHYALASILIVNEIVSGAGKINKDENQEISSSRPVDLSLLKDVVSMLLEEYTSQQNLRLVDFSNEQMTSAQSGTSLTSSLTLWQPDQSSKADRSIANRNRSILLTCLFMEGIGKFSQVLQEEFSEHLIQTLYPLVENLGHENVHISSTAYLTLTQICTSCCYRSVDHLIQVNADYLLNSVSLRLRHFEHNQRTPRVLSVMLRYCSQDLLPLIDHSIAEILDSLDDHYSDYLTLFMPVLLELTTAIGRWFPTEPPIGKKPATTVGKSVPMSTVDIDPQCIVSFVEDYVRQRKIMDGDFTDEEMAPLQGQDKERTLDGIDEDMETLMKERKSKMAEEDVMEDDDDNETKKSPKHIQVVKDIFQRMKNLLSSKDARVRVQALEIVSQGCISLRNDERELLPEIHQLWPGFYPRFHSDEKFVVIKALETLKTLADVSGSFIQQRVMRDVVPGLAQFMEKQAKISCESRSAYIHTNNFKLQLSTLNVCGPLTEKMALDGEHLETVARMCLPYLSDVQPSELQSAAMEAFAHLIALDADALWLLLCQSYCPLELCPPSEEFHQLSNLRHNNQRNYYSKNVTLIFKTHYSS